MMRTKGSLHLEIGQGRQARARLNSLGVCRSIASSRHSTCLRAVPENIRDLVQGQGSAELPYLFGDAGSLPLGTGE